MSEKKGGLPSLRKSPLDFLSQEEARQAVKPVAALDTSEAAAALRRPLAASLCGSLVAWAMMLPSFFVYTPGRALEALNYAWPLYLAAFLPNLTQGFVSGLVAEISNALWPQLRRRKIVAQDPVWSRTLGRRLLVPFIAFTLIVMVLLLIAMAFTARKLGARIGIAE